MPLNRDSLHKHIQRANFQAAIYKRCLQQHADILSPVGHEWKMDNNALGIDWMDSILELSSCIARSLNAEQVRQMTIAVCLWGFHAPNFAQARTVAILV